MKAVILAAGYATRMYPLTLNQPKALLPLRGKPVIDYIIEQLNRLPAIDHIYLVSNHKFYPHFNDWRSNAPTEIPVTVMDDGTTSEDNRRGAIGDISFVIDQAQIDDDVVVIAGDNYFTYDLKKQYDFFNRLQHDTLTAVVIPDKEALKSLGVAVLDEDFKVLDMVEKSPNPPSDTAIFATYFYKRDTLPLIKQYLNEDNNADAPGHFPVWLHTRRDVYAYIIDGECHDIGTIEAYEQMNKI
jgi:glucose-1-phosphate thymidylyltransferase